MSFTNAKGVVQKLGFVLVSLFMLYGVISSFAWANGALAAWVGAPALQPSAEASAPPLLNYQGVLRDAEGKAISGVHKLTFRIYDDVTDPLPEAIWLEEHPAVTVRGGQFSVLLGDSTPLSPTLFTSPDRFIGITLNTLDEMVPRQRFASAPYALNADTVDGFTAAAFALAGHVHNSLSAPDGDPNAALLVNNDGNVGIGTEAPEHRLHVTGDGVRVQGADRTLDLRADLGGVDLMATNSDLYISSQGGRNVILNHTGGRVGVNTPAPGATLDVNGDTHIQGALRFGSFNRAPVLIRRYSDLPHDSTIVIDGVSPSDYDCTVGAWSIRMDVDEDDRGPYTMWTFVEGDEPFWTWNLRTRHWTDSDEQNKVDVICFLRGVISEFQGERYDPGFND